MKIRLDQLVLTRKLAPTLQKAQAYIAAGLVKVNDQPADKVGALFPDDSRVELKKKPSPYVSRGGLKLAAGLDYFKIDPTGFICADIGASSGGFTDCLLQRGAHKVYAVDVGYGQLDWKLRQDPRVVVMERTNARKLQPGDIADPLDLAVIDASFISLKALLPALLIFFKNQVAILALIKPQFEVAKGTLEKGGVITNSELHHGVIEEIREYAESIGLRPVGVTASPIKGPKGNKEFLIYLTSIPREPCPPLTE
ncbi:MAG: TlyA family RNA methyltransferase [Desulfobulbaceae bacterium]|nr:TlyA family RNA methyltransferase [Desulfobulbaceae bacterium]HIJ78047.1 TlyA family RNA methyltransferase [Deltaproteobacteria bacterium]